MEGIGSGKLLLFGEHAVVYGFPGLGIPLDKHVVLKPAAYWDDQIDEDLMHAVKSLYKRFVGKYGASEVRAVSFHSDFPVSGGLGSSAALCIAMLRLMYPYLSDLELWERARYGENQFHGTSSGIDPALSASKGVTAFYPPPAEAREYSVPAIKDLGSLQDVGIKDCIVYGSVPRQKIAKDLIEGLGSHMGRKAKEAALKRLGFIAESAIAAVKRNEVFTKWPEYIESASSTLKELNLSSPYLDSMLQLDCGSLGSKLSGAGGGGAYFHFFATPSHARNGLRKLTDQARNIPHLAMPALV